MQSPSPLIMANRLLILVIFAFFAAFVVVVSYLMEATPFRPWPDVGISGYKVNVSSTQQKLVYTDDINYGNVRLPVGEYRFTRSRAWTVLTYTNEGFLDFTDNWLVSVHRLGIRDHITVAARDAKTYQHLRQRWGKEMDIEVINTTFTPSAALDFGTLEYIKFINFKPQLILSFLEKGVDVLFTDVDMVWLQNPLDYMPEGYDLHLMEEVHPEPRLGRQNWQGYCTGFMYWRSNNKTMDLIRDWIKATPTNGKGPNEQIVFNGVIYKSKASPEIRMNVLDFRKFVSGKHYFQPEWRDWHKSVKPAVVHNNFIIGHDKKMERFKELGLWYV